MYKTTLLLLALTGLLACNSKGNNQPVNEVKTSSETLQREIPAFDRDSAFSFLKKQCDFGPRVPNTAAHRACASYLVGKLKRFGAEVIEQNADLKAYDGTILKAKNIIGVFYPEKTRRVILFAHWDSRPFADYDPDPANHQKPVMGANDGASGVAVLLEIARQLQQHEPSVGVDIVFLDAEDYGEPSFESSSSRDTWCLGAQYWGKNPHYKIKPQYGILLDMVGGPNPEFRWDVISSRKASDILTKVWTVARKLGYGDYFQEKPGGQIIDDHVYINALTGIPTIDILDYNDERGFPETWHTVNDTPENIDVHTLEMVGKTLITVLFSE
jgi:hypothetical protein